MTARDGRLPRRAALAALALLPLGVRAADAALPPARALADELALALAAGQPLVVMVSLEGCAPCVVVRNNYLAPMLRHERLPVVQVDVSAPTTVVDFDGNTTTHGALVNRWRVGVAPTLLFFGPGGNEVADRLPGLSPDFYGAQLDRRLEAARRATRHG